MAIILTQTDCILEAHSLLETLFESNDIIEFRCISETTRKIEHFWYTLGNIDFGSLLQLNQHCYHIYFGINPRVRVGGTTKNDVKICRSLCVDLDGHAPSELVARIDDAILARPHICISSGGGSQGFWRLCKPITAGMWLKKQAGIISTVEGADRTIKDLPRIMRLPGFVNWKAKYSPHNPIATIYQPKDICDE